MTALQPTSAVLGFAMLFLLGPTQVLFGQNESKPVTKITGRIVDAETKALIPARLEIRSVAGKAYFAKSADPKRPAIAYSKKAAKSSFEEHVTLEATEFTAELPAGKYLFRAQRGKEFLIAEKSVEIGSESAPIVLELKRWVDMPALGWYSGDVHGHRPFADVLNLAMAEDVHASFPLSNWVTKAEAGLNSGNLIRPALPATSKTVFVDERHFVHPWNAEFEIFTVKGKGHTLGAILGIGMKDIGDPVALPLAPFVRSVRAQGGLLDLEKHSWPWSYAIAATHKVDLIELANNHVWQTPFAFGNWTIEETAPYMNLERTAEGLTEWGWIDFGFQTWYAMLNCRLKIMPSAGTGSGVHPVPHGFGRVYAKIEGKLTLESWLAALKVGKSFVTTGPLLRVEIDVKPSGETFTGPFLKPLALRGIIHSTQPIDRVEIIHNGRVEKRIKHEGCPRDKGGFDTVFQATLEPKNSGWYAVRVVEADPQARVRFAHTAPWFVEVAGKPLKPGTQQLNHILKTIDREIARNKEVLSKDALAEFEEAKKFYQGLR